MALLCCLNFVKGLINVYTIKLIKQKIDGPHGIVSNNVGIVITIFS